MYCIWMQFCVLQFKFLKKLKHIILAADFMKRNYSVTGWFVYQDTEPGIT